MQRIVQEQVSSSYKEEREEDMGSFMRRLFVEGEVSTKSHKQYPQGTCSIPPNLPLVPYCNQEKFVIKLVKVIVVHSVHEKYKASFNIGNNKGTNGISNLGLQGSQHPRNKEFVLLVHTKVSMA